jgi:hypothetical protein
MSTCWSDLSIQCWHAGVTCLYNVNMLEWHVYTMLTCWSDLSIQCWHAGVTCLMVLWRSRELPNVKVYLTWTDMGSSLMLVNHQIKKRYTTNIVLKVSKIQNSMNEWLLFNFERSNCSTSSLLLHRTIIWDLTTCYRIAIEKTKTLTF